MKKPFNCILFTILTTIMLSTMMIPFFASSLQINEIMYNPEGSDDNREFVEIKGTNNLSGIFVGDLVGNDSLELVFWVDSNFSLIVEEGFNYSGLNCSIYSAGSSIGNNLNNNGDAVFIYNSSGFVLDFVHYDGILANGNGKSLELYNNYWVESLLDGGSPCRENSFYTINNNITNSNTTNMTNNNITNITQNSNSTIGNMTTPEANQTTNYTSTNITNTINSTSQTNLPSNSCNVFISLETSKQIFENKEKIEFYNKLSENGHFFEIEYWIEDLDGNIVKSRITTTNTNKKSYTPSIKQKEKALVIKNRLVSINCENINNKTASEKLVVVKNPAYLEEPEECECSESDENLCENQKTQGEIISSFYTRSVNIGESINLYSTIKGSGSFTANLYAANLLNESFLEVEKSQQLKFSVSPNPGKNIFLLEIVKNNQTLETKKLEIYKNIPETAEKKDGIQESLSEDSSKASLSDSPSLSLSPKKSPDETSPITGMATTAYESKNEKVKNYLNYGLVAVLVIGVVFFVKGKINAKRKNKAKNRTRMGKGEHSF